MFSSQVFVGRLCHVRAMGGELCARAAFLNFPRDSKTSVPPAIGGARVRVPFAHEENILMKTKSAAVKITNPNTMAERLRTSCAARLLPLLLFLLLPAAVQAQYAYVTNSDNTITITGYDCSGGDPLTIPNKINGLPVTSIGDGAFQGCLSLTNLTIPASVTNLGDSAFEDCTSLTHVTIPASVISIGVYAFKRCTNLTDVTIPASVISMGTEAFSECSSLANVTISNGVTSIGSFAFATCPSLTNVTIPASVTSIGGSAFIGCFSLTNITIPASVTSIGISVFAGCFNLIAITVAIDNPAYSSVAGVLFNKSMNRLIACPGGMAGTYTIPTSVTSIAGYAFKDCTNLTDVTIPASVTSLGSEAFFRCTNLTNITIPPNVTSIGGSAFGRCTSLLAITVATNNPAFSSVAGVLFDKSTNTLIECPGGVAGAYTIPTSVTNIANQAFSYCTSLTDVTIGNGVTRIGDSAFADCTGLTSITIPPNVTHLGGSAFGLCTNLTSITIPASVTSIGVTPFSRCTSLSAIAVDINNPAYSSAAGVLFDKSTNTLIECPGGMAGAYTIPTSVTNIAADAFFRCPNLINVTIPASVISIGDIAFANCTSLTSITIPAGVTNLGDFAVSTCTSLTNVTIGDGVISIGSEAFSYCTSLTSIAIPASVISIGSEAFAQCTSLSNVYFKGNAPAARFSPSVFSGVNQATAYYLPGTTGWGPTFDCLPTVLWNPQAQNLGVQSNQFGFAITGSSNLVIVVEACTNLTNPDWVPLSTNTLTGGSSQFSDPQSMSYPARFYRFTPP
jgi:hypothetical protein